MPCSVTFYAIDEATRTIPSSPQHDEPQVLEADSELVLAAELSVEKVNMRQKTTILCATQSQAEALDEFIWQYPADQFVPHNLHGEGPDLGTPLEIIWLDAYNKVSSLKNRTVLICLAQTFIDGFNQFAQIVDFVSVDESAKALARQRYKQYKAAGCQLEYKAK